MKVAQLKEKIDETNRIELWVQAHQNFARLALTMIGMVLGNLLSRQLQSTSGNSIGAVDILSLFILVPSISFSLGLIWRLRFPSRSILRRISPYFGLGYGLGAFLSIFFLYLSRYVSVHLSTTVPEIVNQESLFYFIQWSSWPLLGLNLNIEEMTQSLRTTDFSAVSSRAALSWRNYFLAAVAFYTLLPRLVLILWPRKDLELSANEHAIREKPVFDIALGYMEIEDYFTLEAEELRLLSSIENQIITHDIACEKDIDLKIIKTQWQNRWQNAVSKSFNGELVTSRTKLKEAVRQLGNQYFKIHVLLFEASLLTPYFPLEGEKIKARLNTKEAENFIRQLCKDFAVDSNKVTKAKQSYEKRLKKYLPKVTWKQLALIGTSSIAFATLGWAVAPAAAAAFGLKMGVSAAAAKITGLALLGTGKVLLGGATIVGGKAVIIGGGALLGFGGGTAATAYFTMGGIQKVATDLARLEAILFEILDNKIDTPLESLQRRLEHMKSTFEQQILDFKSGLRTENVSIKDLNSGLKLINDRLTEITNNEKS